jgi:putative protease
MIAFSQLGLIRKSMVDQLSNQLVEKPERRVAAAGVSERMLSQFSAANTHSDVSPAPVLRVLCRSLIQLEFVLSENCHEAYVEFNDIRDYRQAVSMARSAQAKIYLATLRIQKPGELGLFHALAKQQADGWLVRNLAAVRYANEHRIPMVGDFSLNITNPLTAEWLMDQGLERVTASYDLNRDQLLELIQHTPASWLEIVIHQHVPMFHMEHCVFCTELSPGTNKTNCGRPCDRLAVQLEDRIGVKHVLHADVGCRNTLYNGTAQSGAEAVPSLLQGNIRNFRIELLNDASQSDVRRLLSLYRDLIAGKVSGSDVTRGTMEQPRNPLAII